MHLERRKIRGKTYYCLVEKKRIDGKVKTINQIYLGNAEKILSLFSKPLSKIKSKSYGNIALLLHLTEFSQIVEIINQHIGTKREKPSPGHYLLIPIINRITKPTSKNGIRGWYRKSILSWIWTEKFNLTSQNFWNYMDLLSDEKIEAIWKDLILTIQNKLKIKDSTFIWDPTNFFTYIDEHKGNELLKKGKNKQKRFDKNQLSLSMFIGEESQVPYSYKCYPGNVHDSKHFGEMLPELKEKARFYGNENITLVFDKGNNSKLNIEAFKNFYFVGALPKNKKEAKNLLTAEYKQCYKTDKDNMIYSVSAEKKIYGLNCKIVVSYNKQLEGKQLHSLEKNIIKTEEKFEKIKNHLFKTKEAAFRALLNLLPRNYNVFEHEIIEENGKYRIKLKINKERIKWYATTAGKNIIFTNRLEWKDKKIIKTYKAMNKLEYQFKMLHGALLIPIKPIYHWTDQKIKAHIFLCMVALLFAKLLEHMCKGKIKGSFREILEKAGEIRLAIGIKDKQPIYFFEELEPKHQKIMEAFSLSRFVKN